MFYINIEPKIEKKVFMLINGQTSKFFNQIIEDKIYELKRCTFNILYDLQKYEEKYNMKSSEFFTKFENGELGDDNDNFLIWSGIYEGYLRKMKLLQELEK